MIKEFVVNELKKPVQEEGSSEGAIEDYNPHERQYGHCRKPFGVLRMRVNTLIHKHPYSIFVDK